MCEATCADAAIAPQSGSAVESALATLERDAREKDGYWCMDCRKGGHTKSYCTEPGGGRAGKKNKKKGKGSKSKEKAHAVEDSGREKVSNIVLADLDLALNNASFHYDASIVNSPLTHPHSTASDKAYLAIPLIFTPLVLTSLPTLLLLVSSLVFVRASYLLWVERLYTLDSLDSSTPDVVFLTREYASTLEELHARLAHLSYSILIPMLKAGLIDGVKISNKELNSQLLICEPCIKSKMTWISFHSQKECCTEFLGLIHSDLWKAPIISYNGNRYVITFNDDSSGTHWSYFLKRKTANEVLSMIKEWIWKIEHLTGQKLKCFHSNIGGKYVNASLCDWFWLKGITFTWTSAHTLEQNRVSERFNHTSAGLVCTMLINSKLPPFLWNEAWCYAGYCLNRAMQGLNCLKEMTAHQILTGSKAHGRDFHPFGCKAYVYVHEMKRKKNCVWLLHKALYGLCQSTFLWYQKLKETLITLGFKLCPSDPCVFVHRTEKGTVIITSHVDDLGLFASSKSILDELKSNLSKHVVISDKGEISQLLGMTVTQDRAACTISFNQSLYIDLIVEHFVQNFPRQSPTTLEKQSTMAKVPYQSAVGSIMHATVMNRPDIFYACQHVAQFMQNPGEAHWTAVKQIIWYLKSTRNLSLTLGGASKSFDVTAWSDSDFAGHPDYGWSVSGYALFLRRGCFSWRSRKQTATASLTSEAEYYAAHLCGCEVIWFHQLMEQIGFPLEAPTPFHVDS
uniref:Integrase catalytic domain-containing protein n=1 Tax=Moniliophthora roreri TaxID=221103 RepID=A0A0W0G7E0_MONRR